MATKTYERNWKNAIIAECAKKLQRSLTKEEESFVTNLVGFMALEGIEDAIRTLNIDALEELLNSKANE